MTPPENPPAAFLRQCVSIALLAVLPSVAAQGSSAVSTYDLATVREQLQASAHAWLPFLERPSLTCGLYLLPAGTEDRQPRRGHVAGPREPLDGVYFVVAGQATLRVGSGDEARELTARPGAVLFVGGTAERRFVAVEEDLTVLVFVSEALSTRGGMAAGPKPDGQTPYAESSPRGCARIFYWFGDGSAGQFAVDHGRPVWKPAYEEFLATPSGRRWRFGENFWTTLDTNIPLEIAGAVLDVGLYYLVLQNHPEHGLRLLALDPAAVRRRRLDAYEADETVGGVPIPLEWASAPSVRAARRLSVELVVDRSARDEADLVVRFGPHRMTARVAMRPDR